MRVSIVTRWYVPEWKACTIRVLYFVKALLDQGFDVTVLVPKYPHEKVRNLSIYGEEIVRVPFVSLSRKMLLEPWTPTVSVVNMLKEIGVYDVVVATVPPHDNAYIAYYLKRLKRVRRLVIDIRGATESLLADVYSFKFPKIQTLLSRLGIEFYHRILRRSDCIVAITEGFAKYYEPVVGKTIHVVHNGADYILFSKYVYKNGRKSPIFGVFVGDVEAKYHLVDVIFKTLAILKKQGLDIKLRVIGCPNKVKQLYTHLAKTLDILDRVELIGTIPYFRLPKYLCDGDFGIVGRPDVLEWKLTIPVKVYEYIACGLPVFAFGPPKSELQLFIENFNIGVYVPSIDPQVLAKELAKFIRNIDRFDRNHILRVAKLFDRREWASKFANLIEHMVM